jgi:hypothetical protein
MAGGIFEDNEGARVKDRSISLTLARFFDRDATGVEICARRFCCAKKWLLTARGAGT